MGIHCTSKYENLYFIGTAHSSVSPDMVIQIIDKAPFEPDIICVEAPEGLDPKFSKEHDAVLRYEKENNVDIKEIDQRRGNYVPDRENFTVKNMDDFEDPKTKDKLRQGYDESINPQASEHSKERDQMMALELREYIGERKHVVVIVGGMHVEGIISSLITLRDKY